MRQSITHAYEEIISVENLLVAWQEFIQAKKLRPDVRLFARSLFYNIAKLHDDLQHGMYRHGPYSQFRLHDPKPRLISKATVRDRLLHRAIYRVLYPLLDQIFIFDSYSARRGKGTHRAFGELVSMTRKVSCNYCRPCFALKCDIRKFFDAVDHVVLLRLLRRNIDDVRLITLLKEIIESFCMMSGKGMPLGNLTSQLFANVYLDPLDKFIKHSLRAKYYLRYADDFLFLSSDKHELLGWFVEMNRFVQTDLKLSLHPDKIFLRKLHQGVDFVGYIALPHYTLPRRKTVQRIMKHSIVLAEQNPQAFVAALPSYLGYLDHAHSHSVSEQLRRLLQDS